MYKKIISLFLNNKNKLNLIHGGGSDRTYYRYQVDKKSLKSFILVKYTDSEEFERFINITELLNTNFNHIQDIHYIDKQNLILLLEDLGDNSLYNFINKNNDKKTDYIIYKYILKKIYLLQKNITHSYKKKFPDRIFKLPELKFETDYFLNQFIKRYCKIDNINKNIISELVCLNNKTNKFKKKFMHRDFQSQNIILKKVSTVKNNNNDSVFIKKNNINLKCYFIDYQTSYLGPRLYDIVSLLEDPYITLEKKIKQELILYYHKISSAEIEFQLFLNEYTLTGLQRVMQALGAYAFLTLEKKKIHFKKYIPTGIERLKGLLQQNKNLNSSTSSIILKNLSVLVNSISS